MGDGKRPLQESDVRPEIESITFPNTVAGPERSDFHKSAGFTFDRIRKNGEMAEVGWIAVYNAADYLVAEIKESVCDIYYGDVI